MTIRLSIILLVLVSLLGGSCTIFHRIKEDEIYLKKNRVVIHSDTLAMADSIIKPDTAVHYDFPYSWGVSVPPDDFKVPAEEILAFSKLKPNKRILYARFNLGIYTLVPKRALERSSQRAAKRCVKVNERRRNKGKSVKKCQSMWMWMAETIGEKPAELDSLLMNKSAEQMHIYLRKKGYFDNKVVPEVVFKKKGLIFWRKGAKTKVRYHVFPGHPYRYRNIRYNIQDTVMANHLPAILPEKKIKTGDIFDVNVLDDERTRISDYYNERGYYGFTKDYINYDADSTVGNYGVDIILQLERPLIAVTEFPDSLVPTPHKIYFIGNIFVHTDYDILNPDYIERDTIYSEGVKILFNGRPDLRPDLINCIQGYYPGELFDRTRIDKTYKRYSKLGVLRATTIQLVPRPLENGFNYLDTHIRLTPLPRYYYRIEPQVTHRSGNMGVYGNVLFSSRNIFRGAESLDLRILMGLEASQTIVNSSTQTGSNIERSFRLNTFEIGPELTYRVRRLWPLGCDFTARKRLKKEEKNTEPQTAVSAAFNYQSRPDYIRALSQLKFTWSWIQNPKKVSRFSFDLPEFSVIKIKKSQAFQDFLDNLNDAFLANSYQDHLILAANGTYTLNTQEGSKLSRRYYYLRANGSLAGNILRGIMDITDAPKDEMGSYQIAGIRFAQYVRGELDVRYYSKVNEKNQFVLRAYGGFGLPYFNLKVLPFEKSFFSGGSNGLRAWQARTLGPGSSRDPDNIKTFNNIGEIKLEGNFEYRFKMTKMLNWALFVDAGNIWLHDPLIDKPGADFKPNRFVSEIAIGSGIGIRLNFDIFLVRLDLGLKMKDPSKIPGERWIWEPKTEYLSYLQSINDSYTEVPRASNLVLNLGIGFPF